MQRFSASAFASCFNSRSREGSDSDFKKQKSQIYLFQLALPRRERPGDVVILAGYGLVSTRAPAKGATDILLNVKIILFVSTRAPAKGATDWRIWLFG